MITSDNHSAIWPLIPRQCPCSHRSCFIQLFEVVGFTLWIFYCAGRLSDFPLSHSILFSWYRSAQVYIHLTHSEPYFIQGKQNICGFLDADFIKWTLWGNIDKQIQIGIDYQCAYMLASSITVGHCILMCFFKSKLELDLTFLLFSRIWKSQIKLGWMILVE